MWNLFKRLIWQWRVVLIVAPSIASLVVLIRLLGLFQSLEWAMLDQYFCWRPLEPQDDRIVIVGISEADLVEYGWPLPDSVLATVIDKIRQQQPRAIGLDLYRNLPVEPGYHQLVQVFQTTPNLFGIEKVVGGFTAGPIAPNGILRRLNQVGANDAILDADGRMRRVFLYLDDRNGNVVLSLSQRLAFLYLEADGITPSIAEDGAIRLGQALFKPFTPNEGAYVRANDQGFQILLNFRGPRGYFRTVSIQDILTNQVPAHLMGDRIVLIGSVAESVSDYYETPFSSLSEKNLPQLMSGVEIKANLTSQILSSAIEGRPLIRVWSDPLEWLWIAVWAGLGATISWKQRLAAGQSIQTRWLRTSIDILLASGTLTLVGYLAFLQNVWIPVVSPMVALLGSAIVVTAHIAQMSAEVRKTFGRYLTEAVVTSLLETPGGLRLGGEKRKITILMSDLRGFSAISERLPPEQVVTLLNLYLDSMTEVVSDYGGLINQVIGDGLVIFFGALNPHPGDSERAVACAIAMQLAMETVNQNNQTLGLPTIEMGIGINTGEVIVGNIGSLRHAQFTAIGSHVNRAARIESASVGGQVLVSQALLKEIPALKIRREIQARMKGMQSSATLYEVEGIGSPYHLTLPAPDSNLIILPTEIPIQYTIFEDKQLVGAPIQASFTKLSTRGAEIRSDQAIAPLCNIKINLLTLPSPTFVPEDIDAKVTDTLTSNIPGFRIHFTNISPRTVNILLSLVSEQVRPSSTLNKALAKQEKP